MKTTAFTLSILFLAAFAVAGTEPSLVELRRPANMSWLERRASYTVADGVLTLTPCSNTTACAEWYSPDSTAIHFPDYTAAPKVRLSFRHRGGRGSVTTAYRYMRSAKCRDDPQVFRYPASADWRQESFEIAAPTGELIAASLCLLAPKGGAPVEIADLDLREVAPEKVSNRVIAYRAGGSAHDEFHRHRAARMLRWGLFTRTGEYPLIRRLEAGEAMPAGALAVADANCETEARKLLRKMGHVWFVTDFPEARETLHDDIRGLKPETKTWVDFSCACPQPRRYVIHDVLGKIVTFGEFEKTKPEIFALQADGRRLKFEDVRRRGFEQYCWASEELFEIIAARYAEVAAAEPVNRVMLISPGDGDDRYCRCEKCRAHGSPSEAYLDFISRLAARLEKTCPGKILKISVYYNNAEPPARPWIVPKNVKCAYCPYPPNYWPDNLSFNSPQNARGLKALAKWREIFPDMGLCGYYVFCPWRLNLFPSFDASVEITRDFARHGAWGWARFGLKEDPLLAYVCPWLEDDPSFDPEALYDEFHKGYYGPAEKPMRAYNDRLRREVKERPWRQNCEERRFDCVNERLAQDCLPLLDAAEAAVKGDRDLTSRVLREKLRFLWTYANCLPIPQAAFDDLVRVYDLQGRPSFGNNFNVENWFTNSVEVIRPLRPIRSGEKIVFFGDSITANGGYIQELGRLWAEAHPGEDKPTFVNAGVCGDTAEKALNRLGQDVLAQRPDRVFVAFGMNDSCRWFFTTNATERQVRNRQQAPRVYRRAMSEILKRLKAAGAEAVVMTPTPFDEYRETVPKAEAQDRHEGANGISLTAISAEARKLAAEQGCALVDFHTQLTRYVRDGAKDPGRLWARDRVHPLPDGHKMMADKMFKLMEGK